jgi:GT2 family glycosyltransferase
MDNKQVTILVPNYKTPELTKICLRLLRKYTLEDLADVIVIDNDSADASLDYLRSLSWIQLIERPKVEGETGVQAHARALDLALERVNTPYVLSIHTDSFVKTQDWLNVLLSQFDNDKVAGVGSWKLESKTALQRAGKAVELFWKKRVFKLTGYERYNPERLRDPKHYLRSHCALYRTNVIRALKTGFSDGDDTAGKVMHYKMANAGYEMKFLSSTFLSQYIEHLNHATSVLNPVLRRSGKSTKKEIRALTRKINSIQKDIAFNTTRYDD